MKTLNGTYFNQKSGSVSVIRFYDDKSVVSASFSAKISEISVSKGQMYSSNGQYEIDEENRISFSLTSSLGIVEYNGKVNGDKTILLKINSHITNYQAEEVYKLYEPIIPPKIEPKTSEIIELENNWKFILDHYRNTYDIKTIFLDNKENILVLKDINSISRTPPLFIIAYLHLFSGSPFWISREINVFVDDIRKLINENKWDAGPSWKDNGRLIRIPEETKGTIFEIRIILNFSLGRLVNSGITQIPRDVKYYLISKTSNANSDFLDLTLQDFIQASIDGNKYTHEAMKKSFDKVPINRIQQNTSYWHCSLCDGDETTGCLWHDPTECPR